MHHLALPAPGDRAALQELVGDLMTMPLDRNRPLWHMYLVDGFGDGAAIINRMHHCIADGIALARVMLSLTDSDPDAGIAPPIPERAARAVWPVPTGPRRLDRADPRRRRARRRAAVRQGAGLVDLPLARGKPGRRDRPRRRDRRPAAADPGRRRQRDQGRPRHQPARRLGRAALAGTGQARSRTLTTPPSTTFSWPLSAAGCATTCGTAGRPVREIQAMVPFNLRPLDQPVPRDLGNKFGLVFLPLPVGVSGSYRRLVEVHKRMTEIKDARDGPISYALLSATGLTPEPVERRIVDLFTGKGTAIVTNVPGPTEPVHLAGTPVRTVLVWAPTSGHIGMSVSIFSYRGEVTVGLMVDAALIPDPDHVVAQLELELEALAHLTPGRSRRSPAAVRR